MKIFWLQKFAATRSQSRGKTKLNREELSFTPRKSLDAVCTLILYALNIQKTFALAKIEIHRRRVTTHTALQQFFFIFLSHLHSQAFLSMFIYIYTRVIHAVPKRPHLEFICKILRGIHKKKKIQYPNKIDFINKFFSPQNNFILQFVLRNF